MVLIVVGEKRERGILVLHSGFETVLYQSLGLIVVSSSCGHVKGHFRERLTFAE
jgi:hypothetical protein